MSDLSTQALFTVTMEDKKQEIQYLEEIGHKEPLEESGVTEAVGHLAQQEAQYNESRRSPTGTALNALRTRREQTAPWDSQSL